MTVRLPSAISPPIIPTQVPKVKKPINEIIGKGYGQFWRYQGRYRVVKGGRGSKKSTTSALWFIYNMMKLYHEKGLKPNTLVIRRYFYTHKQSTYTQLKWAMNQLGVAHLWKCTVSPMEMTYKPSGQKILFRGMDDPMSITSITVDEGHLCWTWWEEAYQIGDEDAFDKIDMSIRGELPDGLFKQHTIIMNPWSDKIWIKHRFFDKVDSSTGVSDDGNIMAITRNYDCNEFLGLDDIELFETMRDENPRRYNIEGLGNWGVADGLVYTRVREADFDPQDIYDMRDAYGKRIHQLHFGLDFGFSNDPTAFIAMLVDTKAYRIYVIDEIYGTGMSNKQIYNAIVSHGWQDDVIYADSADARTINELKILGLSRIRSVSKRKYKGKNHIEGSIQVFQDYEIIVHPSCSNFMVEVVNYVYAKDKQTGKSTNKPVDEFNHLMDAMRYAGSTLKGRNFQHEERGMQRRS